MKQYCKGSGLGVEISLFLHGNDLKYHISSKTSIPTERLKLICRGKIVDDGTSLQGQNINVSQHQIICGFVRHFNTCVICIFLNS